MGLAVLVYTTAYCESIESMSPFVGVRQKRPFVEMVFRRQSAWCIVLSGLLLTDCRHASHAVAPELPAAETALPPTSPSIDSGLKPEEALWHVRAALNVAALLCVREPGGGKLVERYNGLLRDRKASLAVAYQSEVQRYGLGNPVALDRHMTQLYNFFASRGETAPFCTTAGTISLEASTTPTANLLAFAPAALIRLQAAVFAPQPVHVKHQDEGAPAPIMASWKIQLGAFTGDAAAAAAWSKIRAKLPALALYRPQYQRIANSHIVRLQIGSAGSRADALQLCAAAAAGGFDCMPVPK